MRVHVVWFWITERCSVLEHAEDAGIYTDPPDRGTAECNGQCFGSHPSSPVGAEAVDSAVSVLCQHGVCKWPGCDADCDNSTEFIRFQFTGNCTGARTGPADPGPNLQNILRFIVRLS